MEVNLGKLPKASQTYVVDFPRLDGGLNLRELDYKLNTNESPDMKNLWWQDGILQCRNGQEWYCDDTSLGTGYACYERLFHGRMVLHIGGKLYYADPENGGTERRYRCQITQTVGGDVVGRKTSEVAVLTGLANTPGFGILRQPIDATAMRDTENVAFSVVAAGATGYQWQYSATQGRTWANSPAAGNDTATLSIPPTTNRNGYQYRCVVSGAGGAKLTSDVATLTVVEALPDFEILRQPGNAHAKQETTVEFSVVATGDGLSYQWQELVHGKWEDLEGEDAATLTLTADAFPLKELCSGVPGNRGSFFLYFGDLFYKNRGGYFRISYDDTAAPPAFSAADMTDADEAYTPVIIINASPDNGSGTTYQPENRLSPRKEIHYNADITKDVYHLPVTNVDAVVRVKVDGAVKEEGIDYTVSLEAGTVTFSVAPDPGTPPANNTVEIVYSKENTDALSSVMDCPYGFVAGDGGSLCILLAGCPAQPNAVFWNSNDNLSMRAGYFPMPYYNFCGAAGDAVTGFGQQYNDLILFKERSIGKLTFGIETVDERDSISFTYQNINDKIGCDLPWTIQLIENNLVFCNTSRGVFLVRSSSAAYENNVECISEKVDGGSRGLLTDLRSAAQAFGADDGRYYWLALGDKVYAWDYEDSTSDNPSWYYFTGIAGASFLLDDAGGLWHLDPAGRVTKFSRGFADYGEVIDKYFAFATQHFGTYDRLKDVVYILLTVRGDTDSVIHIRYDTDYEKRVDLTPITNFTWRLSPRNLSHRCLLPVRYGRVAKRLPGCRHVRHFALVLGNWGLGEDLAIVSAQIFYRYTGKER